MSTDHADGHPGLEPVRDATSRPRSLRFVFEFGGSLGRCTVQPADGRNGGRAILVQDDQLRIVIQPVADAFGSGRFQWDQSELGLARPIYVRAPQSDTADIALEKLGEIFLCFALSEWPYDEPQPAAAVQVVRSPGRLQARWAVAGKTLDLQVPTIPGPFAALNDSFQGRVV
ncbi:MAG TPA: hypothetical protein VNU68_33510 [Verrucomicrobiae bacterium]|nr:hypothetical protein [Verrucomicrobiae bacterium]